MIDRQKFIDGSVGTADLADLIGDTVRSCDLSMTDYGGHRRFTGAAATVRCCDDNIVVTDALKMPGAGRVLVVDGAGSTHTALIGDIYGALAADNGWAGIIINGAIRDRTALSQIPLGVKAIGTNPRKSRKTGDGETNIPVAFGGVVFHPGDQVYSDDDGIVVVSSAAQLDT
ncbi:ribonuclease E activity regulator RraA [Rhodococcoides fascians]|uniref:ribonuclease E activity regulator RraA n=1 Tax=Rhodococcoides fascians TaxID=1828 RepID=UPI00068A7BA0|nr:MULTISPECIES: ribonuclease E activity regulator RraA [Rhodococcus]OZF01278.1 S-adenosylmethionine--2-demethylmenaquinone methyltransferase [Rhodococcus sp. 15-1189-1-1a]OZF15449.1 S-adenosylmethionine--2-demethylmenaquinone methyltransferase [Rhodococcus sp. 14-2686-1-2]